MEGTPLRLKPPCGLECRDEDFVGAKKVEGFMRGKCVREGGGTPEG